MPSARRSLLALLLVPMLVAAATTTKPAPKDADLKPGLRAVLYDDTKFEKKVKSRFDPTIDFDFGTGSPDPEVKKQKDGYAIRWLGWLRVPETGEYDISVNLNGGVRVSIDDVKAIEYKTTGKGFETHKKMQLTEGLHKLKFEYYNAFKNGHVFFNWQHGKQKPGRVSADALCHEASDSE